MSNEDSFYLLLGFALQRVFGHRRLRLAAAFLVAPRLRRSMRVPAPSVDASRSLRRSMRVPAVCANAGCSLPWRLKALSAVASMAAAKMVAQIDRSTMN